MASSAWLWRSRAAAGLLLVAAAALGLVACSPRPGDTVALSTPSPRPSLPALDVVDLTIYLRRGEGADSVLVPVTRQVPVSSDLPRAALELLLDGRAPGDDPTLAAPLPPGVEVRDLRIANGRADVDLSATLLTGVDPVRRTPEDELLALAAIANTLTEFPAVDRVRLRVGGRSSGSVAGHDVEDFWGSWGLPPVLVRDETVIAQEDALRDHALPDFDQLRLGPQEVGAAGAGPLVVPAVRVEQRICSVRLVVDLDAPGRDDRGRDVGLIPSTRLTPIGDDLLLYVQGVVAEEAEAPPVSAVALAPAGIQRISVEASPEAATLRVRIDRDDADGLPPPVLLHTLDGPPRVVVDIKK